MTSSSKAARARAARSGLLCVLRTGPHCGPTNRRSKTMEYKKLGAAGVKVSELCLAAMTFGEADDKSCKHKVGSDEETSFALLNRALELGVNFVDTADVYGHDGLSERVIGAWFKRDQRRNELVLATSSASAWAKVQPQRRGALSHHALRRAQLEAPAHRSHRSVSNSHARSGHADEPRASTSAARTGS
jgi:hypothetical protein